MIYKYDRLWKQLIDKGITKAQIRKATGISTNTLVKMRKGKAVAMESLAKIGIALNCGFDDIVEIIGDTPLAFSEVAQYGISDATVRNWAKLNTKFDGRLTTRANKRKSRKRVLPLEYVSNKNNISFVQKMLDYIDDNRLDIFPAIFSLGINLLKRGNLYEKQHVAAVLSDYVEIGIIDELTAVNLPNDEFDILGLLYQSYLQEGKKNIVGSYYTPQKIAYNMTKQFTFSNGELFLDPCCGSGAFLLSVAAKNPNQLYGIDNDKVAVFISKINLLLKYKNIDFIPQIYCFNYLADPSTIQHHSVFKKTFDYIATNPPWGAVDGNCSYIHTITSKETFSYFFVRAHEQLKVNGTIRFLFPEAILNVRVHKDIRKFILNTAELVGITIYDDMFSGVTTKYIDIECGKGAIKGVFHVYADGKKKAIDIETIYETDNLIFNLLSDDDVSVIRVAKNMGKFSLQNSIWALGIVTGDNRRKLVSECLEGMEKIYTGKEIKPYVLSPAQNFILYDRANLQQVAKEEIYRSPEKLVYKFISNKLIFAYDNSSSLFLNSANILIPAIPSMSIKAVMAFLNSALYQFLYIKLFGEVKILKGNLMELPFPEITREENNELTTLVNQVLNGDDSKREVIEDFIFSIYGLTNDQIAYVRRTVHGKVD